MRAQLALVPLAMALGAASTAQAQSSSGATAFPLRPVRFIVPNAAGGSTDLVARTVAQKVTEALGEQVIIDNRPGSGGIIGTELVAKAPPDGHTLLMGTIGNLAISPHLYRKLAYDPIKDFAAVTQLAAAAYMLIIHPSVPAISVKELVALARLRPSQLNYASAGSGAGSHLSAELFRSVAGIAIVHVPYKGGTPALTDVISGQVQMMFNGIPSSMPHLRSGRIRALAVTTSARSPAAPELPTMAEAGFPGAESTSWTGVLAPAGTPGSVIARLNAEFVQALRTPEVSARLSADGAIPVGSSTAEFAAYLRSELAKWGKVVRASGASVN